MRFLVDAQLPPALARLITDRGHFAEHVNDIGLGNAPDRALWRHAIAIDAVLVTKDRDFLNELPLSTDGSPVVVWVRFGNSRRQALLEWFARRIDTVVAFVEAGERVIELR